MPLSVLLWTIGCWSFLQMRTSTAFPAPRFGSRRSQFAAISTRVYAAGDSVASTSAEENDGIIRVALTREAGKNGKFRQALEEHFAAASASLNEEDSLLRIMIEPTELPCIAHADGPDYDKLSVVLRETAWDYVAVTSPEAARVLASAWPWTSSTRQTATATTTPSTPPAVAAVGKATEKALREAEIDVRFCPSKATAKVLVKELPLTVPSVVTSGGGVSNSSSSSSSKVLYPASARAATTLQTGLEDRGFCVTRLDTYDTVTAVWSPEEREISAQIRIACFASPSAVAGWVQNTSDGNCNGNNSNFVLAACIGETSAQACREHGWAEEAIFYPDKPGIEGWVQAVSQAVESLQRRR